MWMGCKSKFNRFCNKFIVIGIIIDMIGIKIKCLIVKVEYFFYVIDVNNLI